MAPKIVLVDMDDVLADFDGHFLDCWRSRFPDRPYVPVNEREEFDTVKEYVKRFSNLIDPNTLYRDIHDIFYAPGFARGIPPKNEGLEAIREIKSLGHNVFICTAPFWNNPGNAADKTAWVINYLGEEYTKLLIITSDKTLVSGDYLIDDKPKITGVRTPDWEHVLMDKSYNRHLTDKKRIANDWSNWREVLDLR